MSSTFITRRVQHAVLFLTLFSAATSGARAGEERPASLPEPPPPAQSPVAESPRQDGPEVKSGGEGKSSSDGKTVSAGPILAGWDGGFFLRSKDDQFSLRLTGQLQADYRGYENANDHADVDTFLMRRARFGLEANLFKYYEFRFLPDFGQGQSRIQDAYINIHYWDAFQLEAGKFKQPFSYEQLIQDRYVPTNERSIIDQLVPARDVGAMIHGQHLFGDRLDYGVSISNGEINGDGDTNQSKDVVGRVVVRPFAGWDVGALLRFFQPGISVTYGIEQEPAMPQTLRTPSQVQWLTFNPAVRSDGPRYRLSPEGSYFFRSFGFMAQDYPELHRYSPTGQGSALDRDVAFDGFHVTASLLLTGEERTTYSAPVAPLRPFDPCHPLSSPGAWELVARVSRLKVDDAAFQPGPGQLVNPARNSSGATEMTLGFNWYLNKNVRWQFNYEHDWFDDEVQIATTPPSRYQHQDAVLVRLHVIF